MSLEKNIKGLQIIANQRCMCTPEQNSGEDKSSCIVCMATCALHEAAHQLQQDIDAINVAMDAQVEKDMELKGIPTPDDYGGGLPIHDHVINEALLPEAPSGEVTTIKGDADGPYSDIETQSTFCGDLK